MTIKKAPNTECVYETIGNYPVVDQFDVLYVGLLSGTYVDNYMTGSMLTRNIFLGTLIPGNRSLAFSHVGLEEVKYPADISVLANQNSYNLQPWNERAKRVRTQKIFSSSERYYDSMPPDPIQSIGLLDGNINFLLNPPLIVLGDDTFATYKVIGYNESFPFESKFQKINRLNKPQYITPMYPNSTGLQNVWSDGSFGQPIPEQIAKIFFGFGDLNLRFESAGNYYSSNNLLSYREYDAVTIPGLKLLFGPMLRGWKYGLVDCNPHYTSAIFRRDRYGQLRDMLEQRLNPATLSDPANSPVNYFGTIEKPALPLGSLEETSTYTVDPPVKVSFVKPAIVANKLVYQSRQPDYTWSSNLSPFATSSLPFFDDSVEGRNRGPFIDTAQSSSITFTIQNNPFIGNLQLIQN